MGVVDLKYAGDVTEQDVPTITPIDGTILQDIIKHLETIEKCQKETKKYREDTGMLRHHNQAARETINKGEEKKVALLKKKGNLISYLESKNEKINKALDYWVKSFGLEVKQISNDSDPFEQYEFVFTKISKYESMRCSVNVKFSDQKLEIISQEPELVKSEHLEDLQKRINSETCFHHDKENKIKGVIWKSVVVLIKAQLCQSVARLSKTS